MAATSHRLTASGGERLADPLRGGAVAIGNFDGVHLGHQALFARVLARRAASQAPALALSFDPHPRRLFKPDEAIFELTPPPAKLRLLSAIGIDAAVLLGFDRALAETTAEAFIADILVDRLGVRTVVVGENFRFGNRQAGTTDLLKTAGLAAGFDVVVVPPVLDAAGVRYSSGRARQALAEGDIAAANAVLGYRWFVAGTVVAGDQRGRTLGFPTANLRMPDAFALRHGIYAVTLALPGAPPLAAVASFGRRPTFDNGAPLLEVHVFDFDGDLYGKEVTVTFLAWQRPEERFKSVEALVTQMNADAAGARAIHAGADAGTVLDRALTAFL